MGDLDSHAQEWRGCGFCDLTHHCGAAGVSRPTLFYDFASQSQPTVAQKYLREKKKKTTKEEKALKSKT